MSEVVVIPQPASQRRIWNLYLGRKCNRGPCISFPCYDELTSLLHPSHSILPGRHSPTMTESDQAILQPHKEPSSKAHPMRGLSHDKLLCSTNRPSKAVSQTIPNICQAKALLLPSISSPPWGTSPTACFHQPSGQEPRRHRGGTWVRVLELATLA